VNAKDNRFAHSEILAISANPASLDISLNSAFSDWNSPPKGTVVLEGATATLRDDDRIRLAYLGM
jgi:hypothetical protein